MTEHGCLGSLAITKDQIVKHVFFLPLSFIAFVFNLASAPSTLKWLRMQKSISKLHLATGTNQTIAAELLPLSKTYFLIY
ncbi:hypothetical protein ECB94_27355 (plasmid) [Vibrio mediterranei]|uniref:Uncharacterized protein n=1 Tax=Vibrio mediterranei TaxID=689 RepID=A0A3G4VJT6_9VIBR|nr:hypothetical protein ECB94_27355 [Vibrio mediterranei]